MGGNFGSHQEAGKSFPEKIRTGVIVVGLPKKKEEGKTAFKAFRKDAPGSSGKYVSGDVQECRKYGLGFIFLHSLWVCECFSVCAVLTHSHKVERDTH